MSIWAEKQVFFLLQKLAYFTTKNDANKLKRYVFSKTAIESAKKQWRQANTVFSVKFGQKNLKNQKKKIALTYPFLAKITAKTLKTSLKLHVFQKIATKSV